MDNIKEVCQQVMLLAGGVSANSFIYDTVTSIGSIGRSAPVCVCVCACEYGSIWQLRQVHTHLGTDLLGLAIKCVVILQC